MAILQSPVVQILLWLLAAAATFWILGPLLMYALGKSTYAMHVSDSPADAEPDGRDKKYQDRYRQFVALGFRPVGKTVEHARFFTPLHWRWRSDGTRWLASADGKTFVGFHRIAGGNPLRTYVQSTFEQGGLIQTASLGVPMKIDPGGNYKYDAVGAAEPEELLGMHTRRLEAFARERKLTVKAATMREIAAAAEAYTRVVLPKLQRGSSGMLVISLFLIPVVMAFRFNTRGSGTAWMLPLAICAAAALFAFIRWVILPSRIPMLVRMVVMSAALFLIPTFAMERAMNPDAMADRILDRYETGRSNQPSARVVDRLAQQGPRSCGALLRRLDNPATKPDTRAIIHDALVRLKGSDLGDAPGAWDGWCGGIRWRR
jgi:hypothetical protein